MTDDAEMAKRFLVLRVSAVCDTGRWITQLIRQSEKFDRVSRCYSETGYRTILSR